MSAYVHPCASMDRIMLLDSDLERQTLAILVAFQRRMAQLHAAAVTIEKPMEAIASAQGEDGAPLPPLIPDFVVTGCDRDGGQRRVIVETMGYADDGYRNRKRVLHPQMARAAGAMAVLEHDFHVPAHWHQAWRDERFKRLLWQSLAPDEHHAGTGEVQTRDRSQASGNAVTSAVRTFRP
jgi:hypothetical protein